MEGLIQKRIERDSSQALYSQLEEILRLGIEQGVWEVGQAIPSERQLSSMYELSRMTVRKAVNRLVAAGLLYRVDGKGTFVAEPKVQFKALSLDGLRQQAINLGQSPSAQLLTMQKVLLPPKIAEVLKREIESPAFIIERLISGDETPLAIHKSYIPVELCPTLPDHDLATESLYKILREEYGIKISQASETLESALATNQESALLGVEVGSPMLLLRILTLDEGDLPIEYVKVVFRGDKVELTLQV